MLKRLMIVVVLFGSPFMSRAAAAPTKAVQSRSLVIRSLYTGSPTDATDESVVLYNNSPNPINLKDIEIEYKSATGKSWVRKAIVSDDRSLASHGVMTFATKRDHDVELNDGLAQSGGNLRITDGVKTLDQIAWGAGDSPEGQAAAAVPTGYSFERDCQTTPNQCIDTDNNAGDFVARAVDIATTQDSPSAPGPQGINDQSASGDEKTDLQIEITELLPDPTSPQIDSKDEFIELYNAGSTEARLIGWSFTDGKHTSKLDAVTIPAGGYVAVFSRDSKLSLNNSGDSIQLKNPAGTVVFNAPNYGKAKPGASFGVTDSGWGWLERPTPGGVNAALSSDQAEENSKTSSKAKATTTKKASAGSAKSASAKSGKSGKLASAAEAKGQGGNESTPEDKPALPWVWILAGLGVFTVGYGAYEYRPEILGFITKLRAKFSSGK